MDPMLPLLGIKMEAVAIVGKSLGQDTRCDVEQFELAKKGKLYIYILIYIYVHRRKLHCTTARLNMPILGGILLQTIMFSSKLRFDHVPKECNLGTRRPYIKNGMLCQSTYIECV